MILLNCLYFFIYKIEFIYYIYIYNEIFITFDNRNYLLYLHRCINRKKCTSLVVSYYIKIYIK